jgi:hypothetical protein
MASLISILVPADPGAPLNLRTLQMRPTELQTSALRALRMDALASVRVAGTRELVYVEAEHLSSPDRNFISRVGKYRQVFHEDWLRVHGGSQSPVLIPIVVYHNRRHRRFSGPTRMEVGLGPRSRSATWARDKGDTSFWLLDLVARSLAEIRELPATPLLLAAVLLVKVAPGNRNLLSDLEPWTAELQQAVRLRRGNLDIAGLLAEYVSLVCDGIPRAELRKLEAELRQKPEGSFVSVADTLIAHGEAKGRVSQLAELLTLKFGDLADEWLPLVMAASFDELRTWTARFATTNTLAEIFGAEHPPPRT